MRTVAIMAILLLGACSKEAAVERGLVDAGVASPAAECMSREMAKRLSAEQLQKLSRVSDGSGKTLAQMSVADYVAAAQRVGDTQVVVVTGAAAAYCNAL
jgi:hypothetical protein